jgi:[ribosomal protein S5]-alanine N-acetyltransferase
LRGGVVEACEGYGTASIPGKDGTRTVDSARLPDVMVGDDLVMTTQPIIPTERGRLIPATRADLDALWAIWREPEVRRYLFDDEDVTRERAAEVLDTCLAEGQHGRGLWTIHVEDERTSIGCAGLMPVGVADYDPALVGMIEPVVALAPCWWGRGHAIEALRVLVDYAFGALALERLAGATDVPNEASHRMLVSAGFVPQRECAGPHYRIRTYVLEAPETQP